MKTNKSIRNIGKRTVSLLAIQLIPFLLIAQTVSITGTISEPGGTAVGGVTVILSGDVDQTTTTDANGQYVFEEIPLDVSVTITPSLDQDCLCAITEEDAEAISNHILGVTPFTSPYQYIAANVDNNGILQAFDIVQLNQLLDGTITSFNNNTCWRFIDANYMFIDPTDPINENFPEQVNVELLIENVTADFVGVKTGNVVDGDSNCANGAMSGCEGGIDIICPPDSLFFGCAGDTLEPEIICIRADESFTISQQIFFISGDFCNGTFDREFTLTSISTNDPTPTIKTCIQRIQIQDMTPPTIQCIDSVTVEANSECMGIAEIPVPTLMDDCNPDPSFVNDFNNTQNASGTYPLGITTVTWTALDGCGNENTCITVVTVKDETNPLLFCINGLGLELDINGTVDIFATDIVENSIDNCEIVSTSINTNQFDCSNLGINMVTITATDAAGNTAICEVQVLVQDNFNNCSSSTFECPSNFAITQSIHPDITGYPSITDSSAIDTFFYVDDDQPPCESEIERSWIFVDTLGNQDTCIQILNIDFSFQDIIAPPPITIATCLEDISTIGLEETGFPTLYGQNLLPNEFVLGIIFTASDSIISDSQCIRKFKTINWCTPDVPPFELKGQIITKDRSGCSCPIVCNDELTVELGTNPVELTLTVDMLVEQLPDSCNLDTILLSQTLLDCSHLGNNTITVTAIDEFGNEAICQTDVTVVDNTNPSALCRDRINIVPGVAITPEDIDAGSNDNCGIASLEIETTTFDCADQGERVNLIVTDISGNQNVCWANVEIEDKIPPSISCEEQVIVSVGGGIAILQPGNVATAFDSCGVDTIFLSQTEFDCTIFTSNPIPITATAVDINGNENTCMTNVFIEDKIAPVINCPPDSSLVIDCGMDSVTITYSGEAAVDNCGIASLTCLPASGSNFPVGTTTVTCTATDDFGLMATCTFDITVSQDSCPPDSCSATSNSPICPGETLNLSVATSPNDVAWTWTGPNGFTTNAQNPTITNASTNDSGTYTLVVTDGNGTTRTCEVEVSVSDGENPIAVCQNNVVLQLDINGVAAVTPAMINNNSTDNCGIDRLEIDKTQFNCQDPSGQQVILTVIDGNNNTATCTAQVVVVDEFLPEIDCPENIITNAGLNQNGTNVSWPTVTALDNCATNITSSHESNDFFDCGLTSVTYEVMDNFGNSDNCSFTVQVNCDFCTPIISCPPDSVISACADSLVDFSMLPAPIIVESCEMEFTIVGPTATLISSDDCMAAYELTWMISDGAGFDSICVQSVTVIDNEAPFITCPDDRMASTDMADCSTSITGIAPTVTDNCQLKNTTYTIFHNGDNLISGLNNASGASFPLGSSMVTYLATDDCGNEATCSFAVEVVDDVLPVFTFCPQNIMVSAALNELTAIVTWDDLVATDNCGEVFISGETDSFMSGDEFPCGRTDIGFAAFDQTGNIAICTFTVEVICNTCDPIIQCPSDTIMVGCPNDFVLPQVGGPIIIDDCGYNLDIDVFTGIDFPDPLDFCEQGELIKWIIAYDDTTIVCERRLVVKSDPDLMLTCPPDVTINCTQSPDTLVTGSPSLQDYCGWATIAFTDSIPNPDSCNQTIIRNWAVTDSCNAMGSCSQLITIQDIDPPIFTFCPPDTLVRGTQVNDICIADIQLPIPMVLDSCNNPIDLRNTYTNEVDASGLYNEGTTTVIWTARDACGNSTTCSMNVFVQACDTCLPLVLCPLDTFIVACPTESLVLDFGTPTIIDSCDRSLAIDLQAIDTLNQTDCFLFVEKTWIISDGNDFEDTCRQVIRIVDETLPTLTCPPDITIDCEMQPDSSLTGVPTIEDDCNEPYFLSFTDELLDTLCPEIIERTWSMLPSCSGNDTPLTCIQRITIVDTLQPFLFCPDDIVELGTLSDNGNCEDFVSVPLPSGGDACTPASYFNNYNNQADASGIYPEGTTPVTWTIIDSCGNQSTCFINITVAPCPSDSTEFSICDSIMLMVDSIQSGSCPNPALADPNLICPAVVIPVCGCDGVTYNNDCEAQRVGVTSWTQGECDSLLCPDPALADPNIICPTVIIPVCGCDGITYNNDCEAQRAGVTNWTQGVCDSLTNIGEETLLNNASECRYNLDLQLKNIDLSFVEIVSVTAGVDLINITTDANAGLIIDTPTPTSYIIRDQVGGRRPIARGTYDNFTSFCFSSITDSSQYPQCVVVNYYQPNELDIPQVVCADTLKFYCPIQEPIIDPPMELDCCIDSTLFCQQVENAWTVEIDCKEVCLVPNQLDSCDVISINWGDGVGGASGGGVDTHCYEYTQAGTYTVCATIERWNDPPQFLPCLTKDTCFTITIDSACDSISQDSICTCNGFDKLTIGHSDVFQTSLFCGEGAVEIPCFNPQLGPLTINGQLNCLGDSCASDTLMWSAFGPNYLETGLTFNADSFSITPEVNHCQGGIYSIVIQGRCGLEACECRLQFVLPDNCCVPPPDTTCCTDSTGLADIINGGFSYPEDGGCELTVFANSDWDSCYQVIWDWGDGTPPVGPFNENTGGITHTYPMLPSAMTYTVCMIVEQIEGDSICAADQYCEDVFIECLSPTDSLFDLALTNTVVTSPPYFIGKKVTFEAAVINQGDATATDVEVEYYVPSGYIFNPADNTQFLDIAGNKVATYGQINPATTVAKRIVLEIAPIAMAGNLTLDAEIVAATGGTDVDSTPGDNEGDPSELSADDTITDIDDGDLQDDDQFEDDFDPALIELNDNTCCPNVENLIINGDFEAGNADFTNDYTYQPSVNQDAILPGNYGVITSSDATTICEQWHVDDHTTICDSLGNFLVINGEVGQAAGSPNVVWEQILTDLDTAKTYELCAYFKNLQQCCFDITPTIYIQVNGTGVDTITLDTTINDPCEWQNINVPITIDNSTATISFTLDETTLGDGNDFAIDDIALYELAEQDLMVSTQDQRPNGIPTISASINLMDTADDSLSTDCDYRWMVAKIDSIDILNQEIYIDNTTKATGGLSDGWALTTDFFGYNNTTTIGSSPADFQEGFYYIKLAITDCDCLADDKEVKVLGWRWNARETLPVEVNQFAIKTNEPLNHR